MKYAFVIIILVLVILVILYINVKSNDNFYQQESIYPSLNIINKSADNILSELNLFDEWIEWPEKDLTNNKPNNKWDVIPIYAFNKWSKHCDKFPITVDILKSIPNLRTAGFSRLGPGTELKKHCGWAKLSNSVLRCHYGLVVPEGDCFIYCNGEVQKQKNNEWLVFDDSKIHSASNCTSSDRIVLLLDLDRPWWVADGKSQVETSSELNNFIANM